MNRFFVLAVSIVLFSTHLSIASMPILHDVGEGWAQNKINTPVFRYDSITSFEDVQVVAYYDESASVVLAMRTLGRSDWEIRKTEFSGNIHDAHNSISIQFDGAGYLHISWDHHGNQLNYAKSLRPKSIEMSQPISMTGMKEDAVTYPEFYRMPNGDLVFLYRDGSSGNGDLVMNYYDSKSHTWKQRQSGLVDGEGARNAYWQFCIDRNGTFHLSWVWRETWDVASNHDICYAKSMDNGYTWTRTDGSAYELPITADESEYAVFVPQGSELINTTSMVADSKGNPLIATYFRPQGSDIPQYHIVYHDGKRWLSNIVSERETPFSLSGGGTKRIPISRPRLLVSPKEDSVYLIFSDIERDSRVSVAVCESIQNLDWRIIDLTDFSVGQWEPSYDTHRWMTHETLNLFVQKVEQGDGETTISTPAQMVYVLEWKP